MSDPSSKHTKGPQQARGASLMAFLALTLALGLGLAAGAHWHERILQAVGRQAPHAEASSAVESGMPADSTAAELWTCSMHPQVIQEKPGLCPICHMQLVPLAQQTQAGEHVAGAVTIDPAMVQNMGVRTASVGRGSITREIRAVGSLREAEPNAHEINLRVNGWIEKLHADTEGMFVAAGDPLFELYSPEVYQAVSELIALKKRGEHGGGLAEGNARKLELWGLGRAQIESLATLSAPPRTITFYSPSDGHVLDKKVIQGAGIMAGDMVMKIVDHSRLWLDISIFERDLPFVQVGQPISAVVESKSSEPLQGEVSFIFPHVEPMTRAATVRLTLNNPGMAFLPGMYATAIMRSSLPGETLLIPREAIIDTGARQVAFVDKGAGHFEPRDLELGSQGSDGQVAVLAGLQENELVVTSGQFLLDSESRLREAVQKFLSTKTGAGGAGSDAPDSLLESLPAGEAKPLPAADPLYREYFLLSSSLGAVPASDTPLELSPLIAATAALQKAVDPGLRERATAILEAAKALEGHPLEHQREAFKALSAAMVKLSGSVVPSVDVAPHLYVMECTMAPGFWLQNVPEIANPYYRDEMKACGEVVRDIALTPEAAL
ncbi:MAG: efflux RND transporter periplasmic adaptor subunit [Candidatus Hydrogenedentes bacterium]|nr:efflux RND transporter periplasmic adaptor subunit [Candidatus Hydrogenedentota bacterium]